MGWKNVKEHYDIKHIVQVDSRRNYGNTPCILIGSHYVSDIIVIRISDAKILKRYTSGRHINELLYDLQPKLDEDEKNGTLKQLIDEDDVFEQLLPVYEVQNRRIVKTYCERYGYPNVTIGGKVMYENIFTAHKRYAHALLLRRSKISLGRLWGNIKERCRRIRDEIKSFRWELIEIWDYVYVRCWGRFFILEKKGYACRFTSSRYGHDKIKATFKAGAEWQKEQMMKDAIGREVAEGSMCPATETLPVLTHTDMILLPKDKFKSGDKVKIIVIKED